jgi:hypothetical protein
MSEFKFNCPVCGQHMAADSGASGGEIECPTCFQKIIVPNAPAEGSKYHLSATQHINPHQSQPLFIPQTNLPPPRKNWPAVVVMVVALCAAGSAVYAFREKIFHKAVPPPVSADSGSIIPAATNVIWTLNLADISIPDKPAAGKAHSKNYLCQRAVLQGGALSLRQGTARSVEASFAVNFPGVEAESLSGKSFNITTNHLAAARAVLRWREGELQVARSFTNGYAMKLEFGQLAGNKIPGKIYLCLPDDSKSRVAGTFEAEIRKAQPRKATGQ